MTLPDIVEFVIENFEGFKYTDDPVDTGGATKFGITLRTLQYYRRKSDPNVIVTKNDVKNLTLLEAISVGTHVFGIESKINQICDWRIQLIVYDYGFHSGISRSVRALQSAIGANPDGIIGPITLDTLNSFDKLLVTVRILTEREEFMQNLMENKPSQKKYMFGWWRRTTKLQRVISL